MATVPATATATVPTAKAATMATATVPAAKTTVVMTTVAAPARPVATAAAGSPARTEHNEGDNRDPENDLQHRDLLMPDNKSASQG